MPSLAETSSTAEEVLMEMCIGKNRSIFADFQEIMEK